ncbi:MAG: geranylgeranylglycerol-phosphate geranylgeranyltransferase [Ginsengibacter sp.]
MKELKAFFRLIRWPNLLFILLTQMMFRYFILPFVYAESDAGYTLKLTEFLFYLLAIASVCIAAAGYIINDYFDVNIDQVNKSGRVVVGAIIRKRMAILLHAVLSLIGLTLSGYVGYRLKIFYIPFFNLLAIFILWFYSTTFKKKLLIGNVLISLLTAWVILVLTVAEFRYGIKPEDLVWQRILKISFVYSGFAFIISLIREVIKDMEDIEGDMRYGCTTMPIVWGMQVSKVFIAVWIVVLVGLLAAIQIYVIHFDWWMYALYLLIAVIIPLLWVLYSLYHSNTTAQFHQLSTRVKLIMFAGILSMIFFKFH